MIQELKKTTPDWLYATYAKTNIQVEQELERLKPFMDEFIDLAIIENFQEISWDKEITKRLQSAYDIMKNRKTMINCTPCEMYGLCAIRALAGKETMTSWGRRVAMYKGDLVEVTGYAANDEGVKEYYLSVPNFNFDENRPISSSNPIMVRKEITDIDNLKFIKSKSTKQFYKEEE